MRFNKGHEPKLGNLSELAESDYGILRSVNSSNTANSSASNWTAELNRFGERNYYLLQAVVGGVSITTSLYTVFAGERMRRLTEAENSRNEDLRNEASSLIEEGRAILRRIEAGAQQQQEERQRQQSIERDSSSRFQKHHLSKMKVNIFWQKFA